MIQIDPRNGLAVLDLKRAMRAHVEFVLDYCGGNIRWAASELGVNECTVQRWLKAWRSGKQPAELRVVRVPERNGKLLFADNSA